MQRMPLQCPVSRGQPLAQGIEPAGRLLRGQAPGDPLQLQGLKFQSPPNIPCQGRARGFQALRLIGKMRCRVPLLQAVGEVICALPLPLQAILNATQQLPLDPVQGLSQRMLIRGCQFCSGRGRRGPEVSYEIADAEIRLVAYGRHNGDARVINGAGHPLVIESHQVLQ